MVDSKNSIGGTGQPITRHPLFPAIVALWCGAIAGVGSVAVSASTIEGVVQMLGIDKVIPMAAPPLGTTMRILLALAMTGLGAAIGGVIARRIAGSRAEALSGDIEAEDGATEAPVEAATGARRRRALAIEAETAFVAPEPAPLPGTDAGSRILNVADFDLDGFDEAPAEVPFRRAAPSQAQAPAEAVEAEDEDDNLPAWLEAESAWREPDATFGRGVFTTPPNAQVFQAEADVAETAEQDAPEAPIGSRLFEAYSRELSPRSDFAAAQEPQFREEPAAEAIDAPAATFSAAPADDAAPSAPAFGAARTQPGFNQPGFKLLPRLPQGDWNAHNDVDEPEATIDAGWTQEQPAEEAAPEVQEDFADEIVSAIGSEEPEAESPLAQAFAAARAAAHSAADRIADAELGALSQVELLERLAIAMERRREEARRAAEQAEAEAAAVQAALPTPFPAPFAAPVIEMDDGIAPGSIETSLPQAPEEPQWPAAVPTALRPIALAPIDDAFEGQEEAAQPLGGYAPPRHIGASPFPAAPFGNPFEQPVVEADGMSDDGADDLRDAAPQASVHDIPFPTSPFPASTFAVGAAADADSEENEEEDDVVLRQGYSSLLNLSRGGAVRKPFLQFGEPDEAGDRHAHGTPVSEAMSETEYGDGESPMPFAAPFGSVSFAETVPTSGPVEDTAPTAQERPFDAPGGNDPEATERALRAALATLQRMSGAA